MCTRTLVLDIRIITYRPHWCLIVAAKKSLVLIKIWHPKLHKKLNTPVLSDPINPTSNIRVQAKPCADKMSGPVLWSSSQQQQARALDYSWGHIWPRCDSWTGPHTTWGQLRMLQSLYISSKAVSKRCCPQQQLFTGLLRDAACFQLSLTAQWN